MNVECKRVKRSYKILFKEQVISRVGEVGIDAAVSESKVPRWSVRALVTSKANILGFSGSQKSKTLNGRGRKEMKHFSLSLVLYMKDESRDNNVRNKKYQHVWLIKYLQTKKSENSGHKTLFKLCQEFAKR
ncbi:SedoheptuloKinase putative [Phytophthora palmivora]|uniref:SedoheptuloKinase putative n=1 Tax=Phytophthora palmivora TaxID=4796 RepID=A0A2P4XRJ0_9STRA|nr:SedoheptuloKinase putative [Phytophthora palmivora]